MSKMYEALQNAYNLDKLGSQVKVAPPILRTMRESALSGNAQVPVPEMGGAMFQLKQSIEALLPDPRKNMILFMGSHHGGGTSTIIREFGKALANQHNKSVLLVDVNAQQPDQHRAFGLHTGVPLESILKEGGSIDDAISHVKNSKIGLCLLSEEAGLNTLSEWLACNGHLIWEPIRKQFDIILVDSPAISVSVEGLTLCPTVDGVVIVVEAEKSRAPVVRRLKDQIIKSGGTILGVAFNKQQHHIPGWLYTRL